ncbi:hypothetical protein AMTRI_Chr02g257460 [Amborella trichopoda]
MSVVGFDIGDENCVVAVAKQRGIEVVLNDESKRETPAIVSFGEKQRFLGSSGLASATMNPKSTVSQIKRLIGRKFNCPYAQRDLHFLPFATSEAPDGGILIHIPYMGETRVFTPVQVLAMLLSHLKQIAAKNLELGVTDCVIGIPSYFTDLQRRAYLEAAAIAGLKPLRLMHDGTATALAYGIYKTDFASSGGTNVVFVDIGHCDTQVCVASFEQGQFKVLAHAFDRDLGGRDFDEVLVDYFARKFKEEYKIDVQTNVRASIRLRAACEKLKRVLSANAEAPLNIECLMDEIDVKGFIKREEFEKLSAGLIERVQVPCEKALNDAGLGLERVHSVELVGSGSRIPAIARMLASFFKREPSRTLNASECVARGCALQCAMLSPIYRVRDYEISIIWSSMPWSSTPTSSSKNNKASPLRPPTASILWFSSESSEILIRGIYLYKTTSHVTSELLTSGHHFLIMSCNCLVISNRGKLLSQYMQFTTTDWDDHATVLEWVGCVSIAVVSHSLELRVWAIRKEKQGEKVVDEDLGELGLQIYGDKMVSYGFEIRRLNALLLSEKGLCNKCGKKKRSLAQSYPSANRR